MTTPDHDPGPELVEAYRHSRIDPLVARDLLADEVAQRWESGYDVAEIVERANATDPEDRDALLALVDGMAELERRDDWAFEEPESLADIRASLPAVPAPSTGSRTGLADQLDAAWLGRIVGCNMGKPVEWG